MTVRNLVEEIQLVFPQVGVTMILKELNNAQNKFAFESRVLRGSSQLTTITSTYNYTLPTDFYSLLRIDYFDSSNKKLDFVDMIYKVEGGYITFNSRNTTSFTGFSSTVNNIIIRYVKKPTEITGFTVTSTLGVVSEATLDIPDLFTEGVQAKILERLYTLFPVPIATQNGVTQGINMQVVSHFNKVYKENVMQAKKYINSYDSSGFNMPHIEDATQVAETTAKSSV